MKLYQIFIKLKGFLNFIIYHWIIKNTDEKKESKINWTNAWGKKYPVLLEYTSLVDVEKYARIIRQLLDSLATNYGYSKLDSMLVLKDILYHEWNKK